MNTPETDALAKDIGRIYAKSKKAIAPTAYFVNEAQAAIDKFLAKLDEANRKLKTYRELCNRYEAERNDLKQQLELAMGAWKLAEMTRDSERERRELLEQQRIKGFGAIAALAEERDQLRQALSGRTVSCDNCNRMASELDQLRIERNHRGTEARR